MEWINSRSLFWIKPRLNFDFDFNFDILLDLGVVTESAW